MRIKTLALALCALMVGSAAMAQTGKISILPLPESVVEGTGHFTLHADTPITYDAAQPELAHTAKMLSGYLEPMFGKQFNIKASAAKKNTVHLSIDATMAEEEYQLNVQKDRVLIAGGSARGVFCGIQTLRQIIPSMAGNGGSIASFNIPVVVVKDKPCLPHRGGHLDVCRHFFSVDDVKRYIDILALHKMNIFHFHLTDDQGWRIEIKKYPELIAKGSVRKGTIKGHASLGSKNWEYDGIEYGGHYTQEQIKDIVAYAAERYITVLPEIEMPGHAVAALASYNWLGCRNSPDYEVWGSFGVHPDVFCAGKETTYEFLQNVLAEVIELFPSKYIHIGGDECPKVRWKECPHCQQKMKDEGLKNEMELQSYLIKRMEKWLQAQGREIIGWDEILEGGVSPTATVMCWQGPEHGIYAAQKGNKVIMAPSKYYYLDYYQSKDRTSEPGAIGGYNSVERVYGFDPYDKLNDEQKKSIIGVQGNLWTEYVKNFDNVEYMILPRIAVIAETGWAIDRKQEYADFKERLKAFCRMYDQGGYQYARHIFRPDGWFEPVTKGQPGSW